MITVILVKFLSLKNETNEKFITIQSNKTTKERKT